MKELSNNDPERHSPASITRRGFLKAAVGATAIPIVGYGENESVLNLSSPAESSNFSPNISDVLNETVPEQLHNEPKSNDYSAIGVTAAFTSLVGLVASEKIAFSPKTAAIMTAAGVTRAGILRAFDKPGFEHEMTEHFGSPTMPGGYPLVPVLVGLAESASHIKANNDEIFEKNNVAEILVHELKEYGDLAGDRPEEGDSKESWARYYLSVKDKVITACAQNAALTSTIAPLGTTYTSAAIAKENFGKMLPLLEEAQYAKKILEVKNDREKGGNPIIYTDEIDKWQEEAKEKALDNINGKDGYVHLNIALSTNLNGAFLIGDPPLIYFALRHPKLFAEASLYGAGASTIATIAENYIWLSRSLGTEDTHKFFSQFAGSTAKTLAALKESFTNGDLRDVSFGGSRKVTEKFMDKISELKESDKLSEETAAELKAQMQEIDTPMLYFDVPTLIQSKLNVISDMLTGTNTNEFLNREDYGHFGYREFEALLESSKFVSAFNSPDMKVKKDVVRSLREALRNQKENDASYLIGALLTEDPRNSPDTEKVVSELLNLPQSKTKMTMSTAIGEIDKLMPEIEDIHVAKFLTIRMNHLAEEINNGLPLEELKLNLRHVLDHTHELQGNGHSQRAFEDIKGLINDIDSLDQNEILNRISTIAEGSSQIQESTKDTDYKNNMANLYNSLSVIMPDGFKRAMEGAFTLSDDHDEDAHSSEHLLSHQATEVRDVLLTQLPAVPSLVHLIGKILPKMVGVDDNGPDEDQLQKMTWATLSATAITSAFADNVAAYLFGENVLDKIYSDYYKENYTDKLKKSVYMGALFTSIVAGSLSKIGNGPNVTLSRIGKNGEDEPLTLGSTLGNPYAIVQTIAMLGILSANIERSKP